MPEFQTDLQNLCPQCRQPLELTHQGDFDTWKCNAGDGVGVVLTEAYEHLQEDEIKSIWEAAKKGTPSSTFKSPVAGLPMVDITITADDDEVYENEGPGAFPVSLSVDLNEEFFWFPSDTLTSMPKDVPNVVNQADVEKDEALGKSLASAYMQSEHDNYRYKSIQNLNDHFGENASKYGVARKLAHLMNPYAKD